MVRIRRDMSDQTNVSARMSATDVGSDFASRIASRYPQEKIAVLLRKPEGEMCALSLRCLTSLAAEALQQAHLKRPHRGNHGRGERRDRVARVVVVAQAMELHGQRTPPLSTTTTSRPYLPFLKRAPQNPTSITLAQRLECLSLI